MAPLRDRLAQPREQLARRLQAEVLNRTIPALRWISKRDRPAAVLNRALAPYNPLDPRAHADPYPGYEALRPNGPVFHHRRVGMWLITGHAEAELALRAPSSVDRTDLLGSISPYKHLEDDTVDLFSTMLLMVDPPDHTRLRKLVNRAFTPRSVAGLEPEIQKVAGQLLDAVDGERAFDVVESYASKLPIYMIGSMLGVSSDAWPRLKELSDIVAKLVDPMVGFDVDDMEAALGETAEIFRAEFEPRRREPRDDLVSVLVAAGEDGDRLSDNELVSMCILLMVAGHETTTGLIGNSLLALDRDRASRRRLIEEPTLVDNAIEELLRFDSPVQNTDRILTEDLEIDGQLIPAGEVVGVLLGAANRDPVRFDAPNELRLDREDPRPLSFGHGIHHCVGAALARLEARVAIPAFLERFPEYRIDEGETIWKRSFTLRGPTQLIADV